MPTYEIDESVGRLPVEVVCSYCSRPVRLTVYEYWNGSSCIVRNGTDPTAGNANGRIVCQECRDNLVQCVSCGELSSSCVSSSDISSDVAECFGDGSLCQRCANEHVIRCHLCESEIPREYSVIHTSSRGHTSRICLSCDNTTGRCSGCGSSIEAPAGEERMNSLCYRCNSYRDDAVILPYGSQPTHKPLGRGPLFFGVEMEYETGGDRVSTAKFARSQFVRNFMICCSDSSINNGFEIITRPADVKNHFTNWRQFFAQPLGTVLSNKPSDNNIGMHIHLTKRALCANTIGKLIVFVNHDNNRDVVQKIAGRRSFDSAQLRQKQLEHAIQESRQHYDAVNAGQPKTVEIRVFKSTLKEYEFKYRLEFAESLAAFSRPRSSSVRDIVHPGAWYRFVVNKNKKRWPHLATFAEENLKGV